MTDKQRLHISLKVSERKTLVELSERFGCTQSRLVAALAETAMDYRHLSIAVTAEVRSRDEARRLCRWGAAFLGEREKITEAVHLRLEQNDINNLRELGGGVLSPAVGALLSLLADEGAMTTWSMPITQAIRRRSWRPPTMKAVAA